MKRMRCTVHDIAQAYKINLSCAAPVVCVKTNGKVIRQFSNTTIYDY